ncbi:hypothetical protein [Moritella viscosa]|nr:hypothetical protein [Moritella viscosa]
MKRSKLKKKLNSLRRIRCHWCQNSEKIKPIEANQSALLHRR